MDILLLGFSMQGWRNYWQKRFINDFVLLVIIFPFIVKAFCDVLAVAYKVVIDLIPSKDF